MTSVAAVRELAATLPRSEEKLIRDRIKFRVGSIVYLAFSADETLLGFAFPKEERDAMIAAAPATFILPRPSDLRFNWLVCHVAAIDDVEMTELVQEAWRMVVPKRVAAARLG